LLNTEPNQTKPDKYFTSFNKECQRYEKGYLEIGKNENKRRKIFNNVLNMNWDYVRGLVWFGSVYILCTEVSHKGKSCSIFLNQHNLIWSKFYKLYNYNINILHYKPTGL
jgi:hypothetical protein